MYQTLSEQTKNLPPDKCLDAEGEDRSTSNIDGGLVCE